MSSESEFIVAADAALAAIAGALDTAAATAEAEIDWTQHDGILEIECEDGSKLIINRHVPNREIWVAAKRGGHHFAVRRGAWRDTRSDSELGHVLRALIREQAGIDVMLPALAAPDA